MRTPPIRMVVFLLSVLVLAGCSATTSPPVNIGTPTSIPMGTTRYTYRGHAGSVNALAWSPDGTRIASGGGDGTVQVWDTATGGHVLIYRGHAAGNPVHAVAWSPDGTRIASGSLDDTVQVWQAA